MNNNIQSIDVNEESGKLASKNDKMVRKFSGGKEKE